VSGVGLIIARRNEPGTSRKRYTSPDIIFQKTTNGRENQFVHCSLTEKLKTSSIGRKRESSNLNN
jgi:hypothetical protein